MPLTHWNLANHLCPHLIWPLVGAVQRQLGLLAALLHVAAKVQALVRVASP